MKNELLFLSKNDIPFIQAQLIIHQPTIKEIAYIGEDVFYQGCQYLNFSKDKLNKQDKANLASLNDFDILMTIMKSKETVVQRVKACMQAVLLLLFPEYKVNFLPTCIMLSKKDNEEKIEHKIIDKNNFESFKNIVSEMFCLNEMMQDSKKYNPGGPQAAALVKKFEERQKKLLQLKNKGKDLSISVLSQRISILATGQRKDMNLLLQYSVFQLFNQFKRFTLKQNFDISIKAQLAGAKDVKNVNWMQNLYSGELQEDNNV